VVNRDGLYAGLDAVIAADGEGRWQQDAWYTGHSQSGYYRCGTSGCFAGHVAFLNGFSIRRVDGHSILYRMEDDGTITTLENDEVGDWAARHLGLNLRQASVLFCAYNTLEDLKYIVDRLCE
jgi:hypothetical protein